MVYASGSAQTYGDCVTTGFSATGRTLWRTAPSGPLAYAAGPEAAFGFDVSSGGAVTSVVALSASSGQPLWTYNVGQFLDNTQIGWLSYADGTVYIASGTTEDLATQPVVRALDARTGRLRCAVTLDCPSQQPAVAGGVAYASTASMVVALDAATGVRLWQSAPGGTRAAGCHRVGADLACAPHRQPLLTFGVGSAGYRRRGMRSRRAIATGVQFSSTC
jgi:outer membrane protein assembly factor BamB